MKLKKIVSLLLAAVLAFSLTGCVGNLYEYAGTIDGEEITSGLYLMAQFTAYGEAENKVENPDKKVLSQKVEGQSATSWIRNRTEDLLRRYVLVQRMAAERDMTLSEENKSAIEQNMQYWSMLASYYEDNGISQDTWGRFMANQYLADQLFMELYGKDGEFATPDSELMKEYEEKNAQIRSISIPLTDTESNPVANAEEVKAYVEGLVKELKGGATLETIAETKLEAAYTLLGREFDPATSGAINSSFIAYEQENFDVYSEEFLKTLQEQKVGDFGMYATDTYVLLYEKIPVFASEDDFAAMRDNVIRGLRTDAFDEYLKETYSQFPVSWRFGVRWYFSPSKIK